MENSVFVEQESRELTQAHTRGWVMLVSEWFRALIIALAIVVLMQSYVFNISRVKGESMQPTIHNQDRLFVDKLVYGLTKPQRGDVIILRDPSPNLEQQYLVKRVVGVPGDTVQITAHHLLLNGVVQQESYTNTNIEGDEPTDITLKQDEYFVMGDNRYYEKSKDSRRFGPVHRGDIIGRADLIVWPMARAARL